jgi:small subunit ribosomal protein S8
MVSTDPISDMLTRIRNAVAVRKPVIYVPYSRIKESVAFILKSNGFIYKVGVEGEGVSKQLIITINSADMNANITAIERVSRPGRRVYSKAGDIPIIKRGRGIVILSTSQGLMTGDQAKKDKVGGELICKVY